MRLVLLLLVFLGGTASAVTTTTTTTTLYNPGAVTFAQDMHGGTFANTFLSPASIPTQTFINAHYVRALVSSPFFDADTAWYVGKGWVYKDLYDGSGAPDGQILKDAGGHDLYIPFGCNGTTCPQLAGDPGNATFRSNWISVATTRLAGGTYAGLLIDDVNMNVIAVGDGTGALVVPIDPRTGLPMTLANWRLYIAQFVTAIRSAFPSIEIVHNDLWFAGDGDDDANIATQLAAANVHAIERGVIDPGIVGGTGQFGFATLIRWVDYLHARNQSVWYSNTDGSLIEAQRLYNLAAYFVSNQGNDYVGTLNGGTPLDWWANGYQVALGVPTSGRSITPDGVYFRAFTNGVVYVNPPGNGTQTEPLPFPGTFVDVDGFHVNINVVLPPASGQVLLAVSSVTTTTVSTTTSTTLAVACGGDVNGDGQINIGDALIVSQYAIGQVPCGTGQFTHPERCDVNQDGLCDNADAKIIQDCAAHIISCNLPCGSFVCPPPPDPNFQVLSCNSVRIFWDLVPGATSTCIQNLPNAATCFPAPQTSTVISIPQNTLQVWVVYAIVNGGQSVLSPILNIQTPLCMCVPGGGAPLPPSNFFGEAINCSQVTFTWTASPSADVAQYCIGNRTDPTHPFVCVAAPATSALLNVTASPVSYTRTFQLWAVNASGQRSTQVPSDPRNPLRVTIPGCSEPITTTTSTTTSSSTTSTTTSTTTTTTVATTSSTTTTVATTSSTTTTTAAAFCSGSHDYSADAATLGLWRFNSAAQFADSKDSNTLTNNSCNPPDTGIFKEGDASLQCAQTSPNHVYVKCSNASCADLNIGSASANTQKISGGCWWQVNTASLLSFVMDHAFNLDSEDGWQLIGATTGAAPNAFIEIDGGEAACPGNIEDSVTGTTTLLANTWYHLAFTSDNVNLKLYVDGVSEGSTPHTTGVCANTTEQFEWGGSQGDTRTDTTHVDECFLRNDALTASDLCHICRCGYDGAHADRGSGACGGCS